MGISSTEGVGEVGELPFYLKEVCCNWLQVFDEAAELDFYQPRAFPQY